MFFKDEEMTASMGGPVYRGPDLYDFLVEAELQHYFNSLRASLKVHSVPQFKYVDEDDMRQIGMSKPEMRRLKKYFHKYCPQTYLRRIKKIILNKKEEGGRASLVHQECSAERQSMKVSSKHMIPVDSITINKELGSGEFGIVQQGVWTNEDGERIQVAIKRLSKEKMQNNSMDFLKEASIMHTIDTEHIVRLYGVVLETDSLMLVTELAPLRSLLECLKEPALRSSFPVISLCDFALQISDGMQYLESKRLIHRDLAARNILVFSKNKVKISDFGLSRALGVGKNYYQTNFNVNLKLPIAWCAAECINYLRFTSASDVWAYGVTLWEMFSYGFQPWAALTGQQILEAIDEPNFHRLEQPESCPKEFYILMLQCWQHDPNKRPKFSELMHLLPESKPEQVLTIKDYEDPPSCNTKNRRDFLFYRANEVITVLDDKPICDNPTLWKGVLNSGKTGLFNPANTVAYLGTEIPSMKQSFVRSDSKASLYSSRRRIRPDMISGPQGDLKHTSHVGLDGAFFGDVSFLGDKYSQLPKQVVAPYKPQDDQEHNALMRTASDVSDRAPLIGGKSRAVESTGADRHWSRDERGACQPAPGSAFTTDVIEHEHEYTEISDEEGHNASEYTKNGDSPNLEAYFQKLDFGPSLMDEVLTALSHRQGADGGMEATDACASEAASSSVYEDETNNVRNEIKEVTSRALAAAAAAAASSSSTTGNKKKQGTVKMISSSDAKKIDSAIAMANELATRNMLEMDSRSESDAAQDDSPRTPSSPNKRKFSFRFPGAGSKSSSGSPRAEKRNFTEEAASIPDIHDSALLTDSAKQAYNSLVERRTEADGASVAPVAVQPSAPSTPEEETNPLRMLRAGITVRPKVRGNKHTAPRTATTITTTTAPFWSGTSYSASSNSDTLPHQSHRHHLADIDSTATDGYSSVPRIVSATLPRSNGAISSWSSRGLANSNSDSSSHLPPPSFVAPTPSMDCTGGILVLEADIALAMSAHNPLPLPPRDRSRVITTHKPRQRKHPLIIPTGNTRNLMSKPTSLTASASDVSPVSPSISDGSPLSPLSPLSPIDLNGHNGSHDLPAFHNTNTQQDVFMDTGVACSGGGLLSAPSKPPRLHSLDDSFDGQIQADMDSLDDIPEEEAPIPPPMYRNSDHVSCEDLLDFACDFPNAKRTQGRARGLDSDEVRIMQKVLKSEVTPEECVAALNETDWDVHKAIKYLKLQLVLSVHQISVDNCKQTLMSCSWDVQKAYDYLMVTFGIVEDSTEV